MGKFLKLAWRNMWRNWRRTLIALIAIVLGLILLLLMDSMIQGSDQAIFGNAVRMYGGNIQIHAPGFREKANRMPLLPLADADAAVEAARAQPNVTSASKRINTTGIVSGDDGSHSVVIVGIEPELEAPYSLHAENISQGRFLLEGEGDAIVVGKGLAEELGATVGDRVNLLGRSKGEQMRQRTMTIVGIYSLGVSEAEKGMVFIPLSKAQTLYNLRDQATEIAVLLESVGEEKMVVPALQAALPGYEVDSWDTLRPEMRQTMDTKASFTSVIGLIVILIASIGILNLMLMAAFERTREMGVLAALGMKGRQIMGLFLLEGSLIGVVGAALGCGLSGLLIFWLAQTGIEYAMAEDIGEIGVLMGNKLYPAISVGEVISRGVTVAIIAALASLYPAWQASRKEPAEALHHV